MSSADDLYDDMDKGSFILPIIHALEQHAEKESTKLLSILSRVSKISASWQTLRNVSGRG